MRTNPELVWKREVGMEARVEEGRELAERLLVRARRLGFASRIKLMRTRFQVLAKVQEFEDRLFEFHASPRESRMSLRDSLESARGSLDSIIRDTEH